MSFHGVRVPIAAAGLLVAMAMPAPVSAIAAPPAVVLLSPGSWTETINGVQAVHVFGRFRNTSTTQTASDIRLKYDLQGSGVPIHSTAESMAEILGPGEIAPFDDVTFVLPGFAYSGTSLVDGSSASATTPTSQPYHNAGNVPLSVAITPCANPDPLSAACQNQVSGSVSNTGPVGVDNIKVMLTVLNGSGSMVSADVAWVAKPDASTYLAPNDSAAFTVYRSGEPAWSGVTATGLVVLAEPSYPMDLNPAGLSFGNQRVNQASPAQYVTLTNKGLVPIHVTAITAGGDFMVGPSCPMIAAASGCTVPVVFAPTTMGDQASALTVTDDAAGTPQTIPLSGTGVAPLISFGAPSLAFGQQLVNTTSPTQTLTVGNTGTAVMAIKAFHPPDSFALTANTCASTLDAGKTCLLTLTFTPSTPGPHPGTLTVESDALNSGGGVALTGDGVGPALVFNPATTLDFGTLGLNQTLTKAVTVTNGGFGPDPASTLTISSIAIAGDYTKTDTCGAPASFLVNTGCTVSVTFQPSQSGPRSGALTIVDGANVSHVLSLAGQGAGALPILSQSAIDFGSVGVGIASTAVPVTLSNTGSLPLQISSITVSGDFIEVDNCNAPSSLPATGANACTINVRFAPTVAGARPGTLTVQDQVGSQTVALTGTGVVSNGWHSLGGLITSGPAASSWGLTRVDVFVRGGDNALWHRWFDGTTWSTWESLGGLLNADPAAVSSTANRIDLFVRGLDGALWTKSFVNNAWGNWQTLGGQLNSAPNVTSMGPGLLDVVALGTDNALWHRSFNGTTWGAWHSLGGLSDAAPAAVATGPGHLELFVRGLDEALWHRSVVNGTPVGGWQSLGGFLNSAPRGASATAGHIDVFALGGDNALWHRAFDGANWSIWTSMGGLSNANPSAVGRGSGIIDLFVRGTDLALWHKVLSGS